MKKIYKTPSAEMLNFASEDIMTASDGFNVDAYNEVNPLDQVANDIL